MGRSASQHRARPHRSSAALITVAAYALAGLGRIADLPPNIGPFLVIIARPPGRRPRRHPPPGAEVPTACCCPSPLLLNGHRLRVHRPPRRRTWPGCQATVDGHRHRAPSSPPWSSCGASRDLERYRYTFALVGIAPAAAAARARRRPQHQRRPHLGERRPGQLPARRVRQDRPRHLLRRLPGGEARAPGPRHVEGRPAAAARAPRTSGPSLLAWALLARRHDRRARPRLVAAVLRPLRRDAVGRHRAGRLPGHRRGPVRRRRATSPGTLFAHVQDRVEHLARPVGRRRTTRASRSSRPSSPWPGAALAGTGLGLGRPRPHPGGADRLHLRRHR